MTTYTGPHGWLERRTLSQRLRARTVSRWVHSPGEAPRASGAKSDPLCTEAADELDRLRAALAYAIEEADRWHDDCRGEPVDTPQMDAARALLRE